jgi:hypothetical protein
MIGEDHMNTSSIFDAAWNCYDDDDNLDFVHLKICHLFGGKGADGFQEGTHGIEEWEFEGKQ